MLGLRYQQFLIIRERSIVKVWETLLNFIVFQFSGTLMSSNASSYSFVKSIHIKSPYSCSENWYYDEKLSQNDQRVRK